MNFKSKIRMISRLPLAQSSQGFILVVSLVLLLLLTILGISTTRLTNIELQIAGNDKVHKETFYAADSGTEVANRLIEENLSCEGFSTPGLNNSDPDDFYRARGIEIADSDFAYDEIPTDIPGSPASMDDVPSDDARSLRIPTNLVDPNDLEPHTNIAILGSTVPIAGNANVAGSGYSGPGKKFGGVKNYDIYSQHIGKDSSESVLHTEWLHMIGQEGNCRPL